MAPSTLSGSISLPSEPKSLHLGGWSASVLVALLVGCTGSARMDVTGNGRADTTGTLPPNSVLATSGFSCDPSAYADVQLADVAAEFAQKVQPQLAQGAGNCASCHGPASGRLFRVYGNGEETFYAARADGFLKNQAGTLLDRLLTTDSLARMPRNGLSWTSSEVEPVAKVTCELVAYDASHPTQSDEEFPPSLLMPYTGAPNTSYENSFIDYRQLKGKVKQIFGDDWVRNSQDQFAAHIGLFGGVDFQTHMVAARAATPEFLLGLDLLAPDICARAVANHSGPFLGVDTAAEVVDIPAATTQQFEAEAMPFKENGQPEGTGWILVSGGKVRTPVTLPATGTYTWTVRAYGQQAGTDPVILTLIIDGAIQATFNVPNTTYQEFSWSGTVSGGVHSVAVDFTNDLYINGQDRNAVIDWLKVAGPAGSTGTSRVDAARGSLVSLFQRMLFRNATPADLDSVYSLLTDLSAQNQKPSDGWSGVCEALVSHPDFLWTLPPSHAVATGPEKQKLLLVKLAQDLLARPPTGPEFEALASGAQGFDTLVDQYLASPEFQANYFEKMRLRTESQGTAESDEPARLWTYLAVNGQPFQELLVGDYSVGATGEKLARPAEHGKTGLLTMKGFLNNKPGLPHYNYPARVFTDFMGTIFEVPAEVFDQRAAATASSTVDPTSICFSCHQNLTPLAHQRLRWDDSGNYRATDAAGAELDDSDRGLVPTYAYKGRGIEAFATQAVKKEPFIRRTLNAQVTLLFGREMRHALDERGLYKQLWDMAAQSNGNLRAVLKTIALSPEYQRL